jgi:hypothetical protein
VPATHCRSPPASSPPPYDKSRRGRPPPRRHAGPARENAAPRRPQRWNDQSWPPRSLCAECDSELRVRRHFSSSSDAAVMTAPASTSAPAKSGRATRVDPSSRACSSGTTPTCCASTSATPGYAAVGT